MNVVFKCVERGIHQNVAKTNGQREEALNHSFVPNFSFEKFVPIWFDKKPNPVDCSLQRQGLNEQCDHYDIRKNCKKI